MFLIFAAAELTTSEKIEDRPRSSHSDGSLEHNLVDELVSDIRGGFSKDTGDGDFVRTGSLRSSGRRSNPSRLKSIEEAHRTGDDMDKRIRKSSEQVDNDHLIDYLLQSDEMPDRMYERSSSQRGRRRRLPNVKAAQGYDRERAGSPVPPTAEKTDTTSDNTHAIPNSPSRSLSESSNHGLSPLVTGELTEQRKTSTSSVASTDATRVNQLPGNSTDNKNISMDTGKKDKNIDTKEDERITERERRRVERRRRSHVDQEEWQDIVNKSNAINNNNMEEIKSPSGSKTIQSILEEKHSSELGSINNLNHSDISDSQKDEAHSLSVAMRRNRNCGITGSQSSLDTPKVTELAENRRWSVMDNMTDINDVIRDVEKAGREIEQKIDEKGPEWSPNNRWAVRRQRLLDSSKMEDDPQAPPRSGRKTGADSGFESSGSVSENSVISPDSPSKTVSSPMTDTIKSPLRARLDSNSNSTLTERALEEHCSGKWKDGSDSVDAVSPLPDTSTSHLGVSFTDRMTSRRNRPYSTYDNVPSMKPTVDKTTVSQSTGDVNDEVVVTRRNSSSSDVKSDGETSPLTKRWGCVFDDEKETGSSLRRSNTLPRRWRCGNNEKKDKTQPAVIEEESKTEGDYANITGNPHDKRSSATSTEDEEGYYTMERNNSLQRQSLRIRGLSNTRTPSEEDEISPVRTMTLRNNHETHELDSKVHQFQSRTAADKTATARKAKFKKLSMMYSEDDDGPGWNSLPRLHTKTLCTDSLIESDGTCTDSGNFSSSSRPESLNLDQGPHSPRSSDDPSYCKSDNESVISGKDEGFESECISDPSVSQRTSMSSTLESELIGTPSLGRKEYNNVPMEEEQEETESSSSKLFARSIDSLILKPELSISESTANIDLDESPVIESSSSTWNSVSESDHISPGKSQVVPVKKTLIKAPEKKTTLVKSVPKTTKPMSPKFHITSRLANKSSSAPSSSNSSPVKQTATSRATKSNLTIQGRSGSSPNNSGSNTPTKIKSPIGNKATMVSVTDRLSRPKRPSTTGLNRDGSSGSLNSELSSTNVVSPPRRPTRPSRPSTATSPTKTPLKPTPDRPNSASTSHKTVSPAVNPFVRGAGTRATMPASVLCTNKKAAAIHREAKDMANPPLRTSSFRVTERLTKPTSPKATSPNTIATPASPSASRLRRSGVSNTSVGATETAKSGPTPSFVNRLATGKPRSPLTNSSPSNSDAKTSLRTSRVSPVPSASISRPRKSDIRSPPSIEKPVSSTADPKVGKSPSLFKKMMDKSKERKSPLNKKETAVSSPRIPRTGRVTLLSAPLQSSRC